PRRAKQSQPLTLIHVSTKAHYKQPRDLPLVYEVKGWHPLSKGLEYSEYHIVDKRFFSEKNQVLFYPEKHQFRKNYTYDL
ncbi:MAG: hypothetical protein CMA38_03315, partial [Euryarchaeota archaeon]|nr:hypothetical protein [Euryarchaeota archaeon]